MDLEQIYCPIDSGHQRGGRRLSDLCILLPSSFIQDIVWTWQSECLLQNHVLDLFRAEGFTGFDVKPVTARIKNCAKTPPVLWELVVIGWAGAARQESGIKLVEYCQACKHAIYSGLKFPENLVDVSRWDGSDFFMVWPMPKIVFISHHVADCIRDNRLTGATLERSDNYKLFSQTSRHFSPGRLSDWIPEALAHKLGEATDIAEI